MGQLKNCGKGKTPNCPKVSFSLYWHNGECHKSLEGLILILVDKAIIKHLFYFLKTDLSLENIYFPLSGQKMSEIQRNRRLLDSPENA